MKSWKSTSPPFSTIKVQNKTKIIKEAVTLQLFYEWDVG